jgi:hypothetical protein
MYPYEKCCHNLARARYKAKKDITTNLEEVEINNQESNT